MLAQIVLNTATGIEDTTSGIPQYGAGNFNASIIPFDDWILYQSLTDPIPNEPYNLGLVPQYTSLVGSGTITPLAITDVSVGMSNNYFAFGFNAMQQHCPPGSTCSFGSEYTLMGSCSASSGNVGVISGLQTGSQVVWIDLTAQLGNLANFIGSDPSIDANGWLYSTIATGGCLWPSLNPSAPINGEAVLWSLQYYPMPFVSGSLQGAFPSGSSGAMNSMPGTYWNCDRGDICLVLNITVTQQDLNINSSLVNYNRAINWLEISNNLAWYPFSTPTDTLWSTSKTVVYETVYTFVGSARAVVSSARVNTGGAADNTIIISVSPGDLYSPSKLLHIGVKSTTLDPTSFFNTYSFPPQLSGSAAQIYQTGFLGMYQYEAPSGSILPGWTGTGSQTITFTNSPFNSGTWQSYNKDYLIIYICSFTLHRPIYKARISAKTTTDTIPVSFYGDGQYIEWLEVITSPLIDQYNEKVAPGLLPQMLMNDGSDIFIVTDFDKSGCQTAPNAAYFPQAFWAVRISVLHY